MGDRPQRLDCAIVPDSHRGVDSATVLRHLSALRFTLVCMRILVVDDDRAVRESLRRSLSFNGYTVDLAFDGHDALEKVAAARPDAMVLDVMMPRVDGLEVCRRLRSTGDDLPILVLTARDSVSERVSGLDAAPTTTCPNRSHSKNSSHVSGPCCDAPPRIRTADSRTRCPSRTSPSTRDPRGHPWGPADQLHPHRVRAHGDAHANPRRVLTRSRILEEVWGYDFPTSGNALEVYVGYLRRKTEAGGEPRLIHTVRGVGYVLRETPP